MSEVVQDRITGGILTAAALVWIGLVSWTIPTSPEAAVGPRAFPLWLGIALAALSLLLVAQALRRQAKAAEATKGEGRNEVYSIVATMVAIVSYGFFMEKLGFLPTTALAVAAMMIFILRIRSPLLIIGMSLGLAIGCYIMFGKLLGTYLPPGTWITFHI